MPANSSHQRFRRRGAAGTPLRPREDHARLVVLPTVVNSTTDALPGLTRLAEETVTCGGMPPNIFIPASRHILLGCKQQQAPPHDPRASAGLEEHPRVDPPRRTEPICQPGVPSSTPQLFFEFFRKVIWPRRFRIRDIAISDARIGTRGATNCRQQAYERCARRAGRVLQHRR